MILIDSDTDASTLEIPVNCPYPIIGSTYLNKIRNIVSVIFNILKISILNCLKLIKLYFYKTIYIGTGFCQNMFFYFYHTEHRISFK